MSSMRERLNSKAVALVTVATLGATACSNPFETGEIGGFEAADQTSSAAENGTVGIRTGEDEIVADVDGDGDMDQITLNDGEETSKSGELVDSSGPLSFELFGEDGVLSHFDRELYAVGSSSYKAFMDVFEQTVEGDYEHPFMGTWDGLVVDHEGGDTIVYENPILYFDQEYKNWQIVATHQLNEQGEEMFIPRGFVAGEVPEEGGTEAISVFDYHGNHTYIGGGGETMIQNKVEVTGQPDSVEDIQFQSIDGKSETVNSTWTAYNPRQRERILEQIESIRVSGAIPVFTHEPGGNPAPVIGAPTDK